MKILMTGASGFVGRHLMGLLQDSPHEIYHLTRRKTGMAREIIWDFAGPLPVELALCDIVIHLAASIHFSPEIDTSLYAVNTVSAARLARYCSETGACIIFASTINIHGKQSIISNQSSFAPLNHYALSKYLAEQMILTLVPNPIILRISGIYGLNGPPYLGLNTSLGEAFYHEKPPTLIGPGRAKRNYICVKDVARWIFHLVAEEMRAGGNAVSGAGSRILYLAGPEILSIKEYLRHIVDTLIPGKELTILDGPPIQDCIVEPSCAPFAMTTYPDYLKSLKIDRRSRS